MGGEMAGEMGRHDGRGLVDDEGAEVDAVFFGATNPTS